METYFIQERDLQNLVTGASFLGTGGGGDPYIGGLMLKRELELVKKIEVITGVKYSNSKSFVLGSAMMGAPIVMIEKIPSSSEAKKALEVYSKFSECGQQFHSFEIFTFIITPLSNKYVGV